MKEKKYWLSVEQIRFLERIIDKIDEGWSQLYGYNTRIGLEDILDLGYYKDNQREWLLSIREDYILTFTDTPISTPTTMRYY